MHRGLKGAIARIRVDTSRGTGALVHDDPPTVLTALHVVADTRGLTGPFDLDDRRYAPTMTLRFGDPEDGGTLEVTAPLDARVVRAAPALDLCLLTLPKGPDARPLPVFGRSLLAQGAAFDTYGFPDSAPELGLTLGGTVADGGRGQLHAREAAAGAGLSVAGLSGAPCIAEGTVVGVVCESLGTSLGGRVTSVGGTLFVQDVTALRERHPAAFAWWGPAPLAALTRLLPAQFEVLTVLLKLAPEGLLPPSAPRAERAAEVLRLLGPDATTTLRDALRRVGGIAP